jgi:hypothetical protein
MVDVLQLVSAAVGFGPAMFFLYYTLRKYTFPSVEKPFFDDRRIFMMFALGVVLGMVLFVFERWGGSVGASETFLLLVLGFALMEELLKLIILNYPKFQRKIDTAFYGLALGLGISSTFAFASVYVFLLGLSEPTAVEVAAMVMFGLLFVLLHGSTTAIIGVGVARGEVKGYFPEALLIHVVFGLLYESFYFVDVLVPPLNLIGLVGATAVVVYGYKKVHGQLLPDIVRDAKRLAQKKKA